MAAQVELCVLVESWGEPGQEVENWGKRYVVVQRQWRKKLSMGSAPCERLTLAPTTKGLPVGVENVHYDLEREVYEVELERYQELAPFAQELEQDLAEDGWEAWPWGGDFDE